MLQHQRIFPFAVKLIQRKTVNSSLCYIHFTASGSSVHCGNLTSPNISSNVKSYQWDYSFKRKELVMNEVSQRCMSSTLSPPRKIKKGKSAIPLMNEHLIRLLLKRSKKDAHSTEVRIVIDKGKGEKPNVEVMSIAEAIKVSVDLGVDLIAINIEQNPSVIKAIEVGKFLFQESKKKKGSMKVKQVKQFQFKAGIADNDLERKAGNMTSYLEKGHSCQVTITSNFRNLKADRDTMTTTLNRIKSLVGDIGKEQSKLLVNEYGNRGSLLFQPNSRK